MPTGPLRTTTPTIDVYIKLAQYPILCDRIRQRMREELFRRGMISKTDFEQEVRELAIESQRREGLNNPTVQEDEGTWQRRLDTIRDLHTDNYFANNLGSTLLDQLIDDPNPPSWHTSIRFADDLGEAVVRLDEAGLADCDVVVAATGDDKVNLVLSLLAKTEFAVPRTVARVNNPKNEWMFDEAWGVDVAVSTPRLMTALIEEAVSIGDLVRIFEFQQGRASMVELTLPEGSAYAGARLGDITLPADTVLTAIIRDGRPIAPSRDDALEALDELLFITTAEGEDQLEDLLSPGERAPRERDDD